MADRYEVCGDSLVSLGISVYVLIERIVLENVGRVVYSLAKNIISEILYERIELLIQK